MPPSGSAVLSASLAPIAVSADRLQDLLPAEAGSGRLTARRRYGTLIDSEGLGRRHQGLCAQPVTSCSTPSTVPVDLRINSHRAQRMLPPDSSGRPVPLHNLLILDGTNPGEWLCYNRNPFRAPFCPSCASPCGLARAGPGSERRQCALPRSGGGPGKESWLCRMNRLDHSGDSSPGCSPTAGSGDFPGMPSRSATRAAMCGHGTR